MWPVLRLMALSVTLVAFLTGCLGAGDDPRRRPGPVTGTTTASTAIALAPDGLSLWVVNPDADSVSRLALGNDGATPRPGTAIPVGGEPWAVAVTPDGTAVVMNRRSGSLSFVARAAAGTDFVVDELAVGPEPGGLALSPTGDLAYVSLSGAAALAVVDVGERRVLGRVAVGAQPWAVAVMADGVVVVGHRLARPSAASSDAREAWLTVLTGAGTDLAAREVALPANDFGFPNALEAVAPAGDDVYVAHLLASPTPPNTFNSTVTGGLSRLSTAGAAAGSPLTQTLSLDVNAPGFSTPTNFPRAVAVSPTGPVVYLALTGSDSVMGIDLADPSAPQLVGFWPTGSNPRGLALSHDGVTAYVMNYLSRDVSVLDLTNGSERRESARIPTVGETLSPEALRGKVLFNKANDPRLSRNGWLSCATCHLDGGGDGTTWPRDEGARQTMPLWSLAGTAPFHAAATRDELQDFEIDIERFMGGVGLAPGAVGSLLGAPNAGRSADLDALAAFVLHGFRPPTAPEQDAAAVARGRAVFAGGCQECHAGPSWTTSSLPGEPGTLAPGAGVVAAAVHDVGTFNLLHDITGAAGFDVPSLLGLAYTAPYFHDGSAATLRDVLAHEGHSGAPLPPQDVDDLLAFLLSIDGASESFPVR